MDGNRYKQKYLFNAKYLKCKFYILKFLKFFESQVK